MSNHVDDPVIGSFAPMTISDSDFRRLANFIHSNYGIDLSQKRQLITGRLSTTIRQKGYRNFSDFVDHLLKVRDNDEITLVLNKHLTFPPNGYLFAQTFGTAKIC